MRQDLVFLHGEVVAVIHKVSRRGRFHGRAPYDPVLQYVIEVFEQGAAGGRQLAMLLEEAVDRDAQPGIALDQARKRRVLARMMVAVGVVVEIVDDVVQQFVVGILPVVERAHLLFDVVEQARKAQVLRMPNGDRISHDDPPWNGHAQAPGSPRLSARGAPCL